MTDVELRDDASGGPSLVVSEEDAEWLCDYLDSRGIVCRKEEPAEPVGIEGPVRVTILLAPETDRRRVRALSHRWKIQVRGHRGRMPVIAVAESKRARPPRRIQPITRCRRNRLPDVS
jgi:hypothetical protein